MNGYEIYVYGSYGFAAVLLLGLCLQTYMTGRRHKK